MVAANTGLQTISAAPEIAIYWHLVQGRRKLWVLQDLCCAVGDAAKVHVCTLSVFVSVFFYVFHPISLRLYLCLFVSLCILIFRSLSVAISIYLSMYTYLSIPLHLFVLHLSAQHHFWQSLSISSSISPYLSCARILSLCHFLSDIYCLLHTYSSPTLKNEI